jgi:hypothetical protein
MVARKHRVQERTVAEVGAALAFDARAPSHVSIRVE